MSTITITISDDVENESVNVKVEIDPPAIDGVPMTGAQLVAVHAMQAINSMTRGKLND
jgi:hypothetical protein